jgi:Cys-rich four helix bundle protein (predicted Tat secretion target)
MNTVQRRQFLQWGLGSAFVTSACAAPGETKVMAQAKPEAGMAAPHDHAAMMKNAAPAMSRKYDVIIPAYQDCTRSAQTCIAHCQTLLAKGDTAMSDCLRAALDTEAVCGVVLKLTGINSQFAGVMARQSVAVMEVCIKACEPHITHHAECKACYESCERAVKAAKAATA